MRRELHQMLSLRGQRRVLVGVIALISYTFFLFITMTPLHAEDKPTSTLKERIAAASPGATIVVDHDESIIETITINKPIILQGMAGVKIATSGGENIFNVTSEGVVFTGLAVIKSDTTPQTFISSRVSAKVEKTTFEAQYLQDKTMMTRAIELTAGAGFVLDDNIFLNVRQPVYALGQTSGSMTGNHSTGFEGWRVATGTNFTFAGNIFDVSDAAGVLFEAADSNNYSCEAIRSIIASNNTVSVYHQMQPTPCITPQITIDTSPLKGRLAKGTINMGEAGFTLEIDGTVHPEIAVTIHSSQDESGLYVWSFLFPDDIATGGHTVKMIAWNNGVESAPVSALLMLQDDLVSVVQGSGSYIPLTVNGEDPVLAELSKNLSQPFITPDTLSIVAMQDVSPYTGNVGVSANQGGDVLGAENIKAQEAVVATKDGWRLFGVAWYWWVAGVLAAAFMAKRAMKRRALPVA